MSDTEIVEPKKQKKRNPFKPYVVGILYGAISLITWAVGFIMIGFLTKVVVIAFKCGWNLL